MSVLKKNWLKVFNNKKTMNHWWERKQHLFKSREANIIKIKGKGKVFQEINFNNQRILQYDIHLSYFIKQHEFMYMEEQSMLYEAKIIDDKLKQHQQLLQKSQKNPSHSLTTTPYRNMTNKFNYNRRAAVQYAERWWNSYNPVYERFLDDCTNYISQCLFAGGALMSGMPNRDQGWWYGSDNWSYSWAVAHSLRWYLSSSENEFSSTEVEKAESLHPGDIICYDFSGDGRWDHVTIVVAKDNNNMPLVNAHTDNSRNRYWSYEDSPAWTPSIKYKFFQIGTAV